MTVPDQTNERQLQSDFSTPEVNEHLSALQQEKARLENCVAHLERSNLELQEALLTDPDEEYQNAVKENKRTINAHQGEIYKIAVEIAGITGKVSQVTPPPPQTQQAPQEVPSEGQWL